MSDPQKELRSAWDDLIAELQRARDAIDQPQLMPAPQNARNLAEGYRYLMGFVYSAVERAFHEDPVRPHFRNALSIVNRATIDNADAIYFYAPIDGRSQTLIRGQAMDSREWRGQEPPASGRKAPIPGKVSSESASSGNAPPNSSMHCSAALCRLRQRA